MRPRPGPEHGLLPPLALDPASREPLQRQLAARLRARVHSGELPPGRRLPATRALAAELGLSRNTVLYAYEQLAAEGYLVTRRGAGTFVARVPKAARGTVTEPAASAPPAPRLACRLARLGNPLPLPAEWGTPAPFAVGFPDPRLFPRAAFARLAARAWREGGAALFHYGDPRGAIELREQIARYLCASRGVRCSAGEVLVTHGSQQALELVARVLLDPGERAWVEDPGYHGARAAFRAAGAELVSVPLDEEGLDLERMSRAPAPRVIALTPSNQFPTGVSTSLARRLALLELACAHEAWIVEDDYDSEFRYRGAPLPALQGLDGAGRVLYVGTFSKTLSPALRLGYVVLPPALVEPFARARSVSDTSPSPIAQRVVADFLAGGHFARHIARVRRVYRARQAFLAQGLAARSLASRPASGGLHLVVDLPPGTDELAIWERLRARGVQGVPMSMLRLRAPARPEPALLLGYAGFDEDELAAALDVLARVVS